MDKSTERAYLKTTVACILLENGIQVAEPAVLETLAEMLYTVLSQIGNNSRRYAELAGRLEPLGADVMMGLIDIGLFKSASSLLTYAKRSNRAVLPSPVPSVQPHQINNLQVATRFPHSPYIPRHMPAFPDPCSYIRTPTHKQPVTEFDVIREKSTIQKREMENNLITFLIKTGSSESLFLNQENDCFPLIGNKPPQPAYLSALLPNDQVFGDDPNGDNDISEPSKEIKINEEVKIKNEFDENYINELERKQEEPIDNPFLKPVKYPRFL